MVRDEGTVGKLVGFRSEDNIPSHSQGRIANEVALAKNITLKVGVQGRQPKCYLYG